MPRCARVLTAACVAAFLGVWIEKGMGLIVKALIKVGYGCNDHCSFCHTLDVRHVDAEAAEVSRKIDRAKALGHTMVVLSGGEPTIRPELVGWASHVARLGMDFGLVTNGRMLSYPELVEQLIARRLRYVYLSLHGGTAKVHDLMVRSQAFEETYGAIGVLSGRGLDFTVNCVVTRHNLEHLRGVVDSILPYRDVTLTFSMVEPKGGGAALFEHLMPRVTDVAARVADAIRYGRERAPDGPRFRHGGIPLCLVPGLEPDYGDLKTHRFRTMVEVGEPDFYPVDDQNKVQPDACRGCGLRGGCPGLYRGYHEAFGDGELRPSRDRPRGNSFSYTFDALLTTDAGERCPLRDDGVTPWDHGRDLVVRHGSRIARFRADTRDFADPEIASIKRELGQVYLDLSGKEAPDDFTTDLRPLRPSAMCDGCVERPRCTGMLEPALDEEPFGRDDRRVRELVGALEGDVLDIGVGEGRYEDVLAPRVAAGTIRYAAFDPDPAVIARLLTRRPSARAWVGTAEAWADEAQAESVDSVLVLRSWNHLVDPARVMRGVARALRPGGSLVVVDDVAFALVRSRPQARRAESSGARLEHYRNDSAEDAIRMLEGTPLRVVERRDAGPGTSTLWLVRCVRVAD